MTGPSPAGGAQHVVGVGLDVVELERMRTSMARTPALAERLFTAAERAYCEGRRDPTERFAVRFAAKEAVLKVLGEGILRVPLREIEVVRADSGKPSIVLHGSAADKAAALNITTWQLSLTHTDTAASAVAIGLYDATHVGPPADAAEAGGLHDTALRPAGPPAAPAGAGPLHDATDLGALMDPVTGLLPDDVYYARLDRKRNAAGALLFDGAGRLLVVDPTYRQGWGIPGGAVDAGESPRMACARELAEELGLSREVGRLLAVDWKPGDEVRGEQLAFVFDGGVLSPAEVNAIVLPHRELAGFAFVSPVDAVARLYPPALGILVQAALDVRRGDAAAPVAWLDAGRPAGSEPGPTTSSGPPKH